MSRDNTVELIAKLRDELSGPLNRVGTGLGNFGKAAGAAAAAAAVLATAVFAAARKLAQYGATIYDTAAMTGLTAERIQGLAYVFEQTGGSATSFQSSLRGLATFMRTASSATSEQGKLLQDLGLQYDELQAMQPDQLFMTLSSALYDSSEGMELLTNAATVFGGRYSQQVVSMLQETGGNVEGMIEDFNALGVALSTDQVNALKKFDDAMTDMSFTMKGLAGDVIVPMLEPLKGMMDLFREIAMKALPGLAPLIDDAVSLFSMLLDKMSDPAYGAILDVIFEVAGVLLEALQPAMGAIMDSLGQILPPFADLLGSVGDLIAPVMQLAGVLSGPLLSAFATLVSGPVYALAYLMEGLTNVLGLAGTATDALVMSEDDAREATDTLVTGLSEGIQAGGNFANAIAALTDNLRINVLAFGEQAEATEMARQAYQTLVDTVYGEAINAMQDYAASVERDVLAGIIDVEEGVRRLAAYNSVYGGTVSDLADQQQVELKSLEDLNAERTVLLRQLGEVGGELERVYGIAGDQIDQYERMSGGARELADDYQRLEGELNAVNTTYTTTAAILADNRDVTAQSVGLIGEHTGQAANLRENLMRLVTEGQLPLNDAVREYGDYLADTMPAVWDLSAADEEAIERVRGLKQAFFEEAVALTTATEATNENTTATTENAEAAELVILANQELLQLIADRAAARLDGVDAINAEYDAELLRVEELAMVADDLAAVEEARASVEQDRAMALHTYKMDLIKQEAEAQNALAAQKEQAAARYNARLQQEASRQDQIFGQLGGGLRQAMMQGEEGIQAWANQFIDQMLKIVAQAAFMTILRFLTMGGGGKGFFKGLLGLQGGGGIHHAQGGFRAPGTGPYGDRHLVMIERDEEVVQRERVIQQVVSPSKQGGGILNFNYGPTFSSGNPAEMADAARMMKRVFNEQGVAV